MTEEEMKQLSAAFLDHLAEVLRDMDAVAEDPDPEPVSRPRCSHELMRRS